MNSVLSFCLREAGHPVDDTTSCPLSLIRNLGSNPRSLSLTHIEGPWPLVYNRLLAVKNYGHCYFQENGVQLLVIVNTENGTLIDNIILNISFPSGPEQSPVANYTGEFGIATLRVGLGVQCRQDFFGEDCNTSCQGRNDSSGHFECDPVDGTPICLDGYRNVSSGCVECAPADGCCKTFKLFQ